MALAGVGAIGAVMRSSRSVRMSHWSPHHLGAPQPGADQLTGQKCYMFRPVGVG